MLSHPPSTAGPMVRPDKPLSQTYQLQPNLKFRVSTHSLPAQLRQLECTGEVNTAASNAVSHFTSPKAIIPTFEIAHESVKQGGFHKIQLESLAIPATQLLDLLKAQGKELKKLEMVNVYVQLDSSDWDDDDEPYPFLTMFLHLLQGLEVEDLQIKHLVCNAIKRPQSRQVALDGREWRGVKGVLDGFAGLIEQFRKERKSENKKIQDEASHSKVQSSFIEQESWDDEYGFGPEEESDEDPYVHDDDGEWQM
ncbi:hypothetical protein D6D13_02055 [Aureobasidium pullulans]|uniref:Uncharacterized protein n=1 Tax=Aureobasidium pullulans TaxID=5580 RepID=A0A4V4J285_AURPU|nr:hypothetical protein D6D13_02055 [Aureobasidium pullulans]